MRPSKFEASGTAIKSVRNFIMSPVCTCSAYEPFGRDHFIDEIMNRRPSTVL
jgi:hypothetical protein